MRKMPKLKALIPLFALPLILMVCLALWVVMSNVNSINIESTSGTWDLRGLDFDAKSARITGQVEYIPGALLTPEEFDAHADKIQLGYPKDSGAEYSTSRIRILLPPNATYMLAGRSVDYSNKVFINGKWMADVGRPGTSKETTIPDTTDYYFMDEPVNGEIVIVQQASNFVHREGGWHDDWRVGYPEVVRASYRSDVTAIVMGCFLALFLVHLSLFFILRSYRANLYFSLFCLVWFLRSGMVGIKLFSTLLPSLSWYVRFRVEYISLPVTGVLLILMLHELFPGVLPVWLRRGIYGLSAGYIVFFLFADTYLMSWAVLGCYAYEGLAILLVMVYFVRRFRRPNMAQAVSLSGVAIFLYAAFRDMFYYNDIMLPPFVNADLSQISMLIFVFFQMTAMFFGTVHAAERAKEVEQRLAAENAALDRLSRMKNDFIATVSHETRTPLAVLSGYAELIAMQMRKKGVDEQTAADLESISTETLRIAGIMDELQVLGDGDAHAGTRVPVQVTDLITQTARLYAHILARQNTRLEVNAPAELPQVYASPGEVTQVLLNLLTNAKSHTKDGQITLSAQQEGPWVAVTVEDTGDGIDPAFLPNAFERGNHTEGEGTGIGLSVCRQIIEEHGGQIELHSTPGEGTRVRFTLPVAKGAQNDGGE